MKRRGFLAGSVMAASMLAACASGAGRDAPAAFTSDRISVTTQGSGQDVIFIPGLSSSREIWDTTVAALGPNYRVHLVQVNGFAGAPIGANGEGPVAAPVAEEIARYIRDAGLERPAVIGHSLGGTMGMMLTARHPELVGKLMVVDMFPFMGAMFGGPAATPESLAPVADQIRTAMLASPQGVVSERTVQTINSMVRTESARARIIEHSRLSNVPAVANAYHELILADLRPELRNITQPVTVLFVIPPQAPISAEQYEGFMRASYVNTPQARVVKIDESYHFIMIDQLDRFVAEVRTFLAE